MSKRIASAAVVAALVGSSVASADFDPDHVTYEAEIQIRWYNDYLGERTTTEHDGTVTVRYQHAHGPPVGGDWGFWIEDLTFNEEVPGLGTMVLGVSMPVEHPFGLWDGLIHPGNSCVARGTMGFAGTLAGTYQLSNVGGEYSGLAPHGKCYEGDVYSLTAAHQGTVTSPIVGGTGNWDLIPTDTKITFGIPEPASLLLLGLGGLAVTWRKRR